MNKSVPGRKGFAKHVIRAHLAQEEGNNKGCLSSFAFQEGYVGMY